MRANYGYIYGNRKHLPQRQNNICVQLIEQYFCTEICVVLTTHSLDEALGVVPAVVISHDDLFTTFEGTGAWPSADARVLSVWSSGARVSASFAGRNRNALSIVLCNVGF